MYYLIIIRIISSHELISNDNKYYWLTKVITVIVKRYCHIKRVKVTTVYGLPNGVKQAWADVMTVFDFINIC